MWFIESKTRLCKIKSNYSFKINCISFLTKTVFCLCVVLHKDSAVSVYGPCPKLPCVSVRCAQGFTLAWLIFKLPRLLGKKNEFSFFPLNLKKDNLCVYTSSHYYSSDILFWRLIWNFNRLLKTSHISHIMSEKRNLKGAKNCNILV